MNNLPQYPKQETFATAGARLKHFFARKKASNPHQKIPTLALSWLNDKKTVRQIMSLGVKKAELTRLANLPELYHTSTQLFGKQIEITSPFWYLHGLKEIFIDQTYFFETTVSAPRIIDCGANVGMSIIYFKRLFPLAKLVAFEPDKDLAAIARKNLRAFGIVDVELLEKAVWVNDNHVTFAGDGSIGGSIVAEASENARTESVPAARLCNFLHQRIHFLKIDIEGAEVEVLKDCADALASVENIFIEYHSLPSRHQELATLLEILQQTGFRYYLSEAWKNMLLPFVQKTVPFYDLQLNISAYRGKHVSS